MSAAFLLLPNLIGVPSALNPGRYVGSVIEQSDRDETTMKFNEFNICIEQ